MKKLVLLAIIIFAISCELPLDYYEWTITGDVSIEGTPISSVQLAAFYTYDDSYQETVEEPAAHDAVLVSNIIDIGTIGSTFSLTIKTQHLNPTAGDSIYLIMWQDTNSNSIHEQTEDWEYVIPQYGCPVFQDSIFCKYYWADTSNYFMGTEYGWNQSIGLATYIPVIDATKDNAKIENYFTW